MYQIKSIFSVARNCVKTKVTMTNSLEYNGAGLKVKLCDRLSEEVKPINYNLSLFPNLETGDFSGKVDITLLVKKAQNSLRLHSKYLTIDDVKLFKEKDEILIKKYLEVQHLEQLNIHFDKLLPAGQYKLSINYNGNSLNKLVGLYSSRLKNRTMIASKFEPTYARQAFPCFDEPEYKATFDITLGKPKTHIALSNMNEISTQDDPNQKDADLVTFATSVPMSTYLACFVICDFDSKVTNIDAKGIGKNFTLRSFAQKGETHKIDFAQDIGKRATEFYINYYEVPFPLPKLDMIAIPDYASGATEHWGLITYRETSFLVDKETASTNNKISVANTIAHELAHMWFGNLVTMKWWDDLWLNEGFATYMQVKALDSIEPSWVMLEQFLTKTMHTALKIDAELSSHPIVQTVETPDEITAIFDSISYNKGSSILRMLEGFIGKENFRRGVSDYLKKYEFGSTVTSDLLSCLEPHFKCGVPNLTLSSIMDTWTRQMGYPVLTVKQGHSPNSVVITQSRFLSDPKAVSPNDSQFGYRWAVPITFTSNLGVNDNIIWLPYDSDSVIIALKDKESWLKINNNQVGYYRVNYSPELWEKLIAQLKQRSPLLTISDRANLINDVFALAKANHVSYDLALNLISYLTVEEDYVPWVTADGALAHLKDRLIGTAAYKDLQKHVQTLVTPIYTKQTWERAEFTINESLLRIKILKLASSWGLPDAEQKVRGLFLKWLDSKSNGGTFELEPDLRGLVYFEGLKTATQSEWDKVWQIYLKETDVQEISKLQYALTAPEDQSILERYLSLAWDESNVRSQDYLSVVTYIGSNPSGTALAWDFVRDNWEKLVERFTLNSRYLGNLIPGVTQKFATDEKLKEMEVFFAKYPEAGAGATARRRALELVRNNVYWTKTHLRSVTNWLKQHTDSN